MAANEIKQPPQLKQEADEWFGLMSSFLGYFSKPDITSLAPNCLVAGSKNVYIDYAQRVVSRPGYTLFGAANTGLGGIVSSYEWETSIGSEFALRTHDNVLEFYWNNAWNQLMSGLESASMEFTALIDMNEEQDVLLGVNGDGTVKRWSGGVTKVWKATSTTITKQGAYGPMSIGNATISIGTPGVITLTAHGFSNGAAIQFSVSNGILPVGIVANTTYYVSVIDANTFNISSSNTLSPLINTSNQAVTISIASAAVITLANHGLVANDIVYFNTTGALPTGMSSGGANTYFVLGANISANTFEISASPGGVPIATSGTQSGTQTIVANNPTITVSSISNVFGISFAAGTPATILDSNNNFVNAGFAAGDTLMVTGSAANSKAFTIASVTAGVITLIANDSLTSEVAGQPIWMYNQTGASWKAARFFNSIGDRAILINGTAYSYSGGETTPTLTGLSGLPAITLGQAVWQQVDDFTPVVQIAFGAPPLTNYYPNLIGTQLNMLFLASTQSNFIFGSDEADYTNFILTDPRAPGDPFFSQLTSGPATCIVPIDTVASTLLNTQSSLIYGSGRDAFDQITFRMDSANTYELVYCVRYKTAKSMGLLSKDAICPVKLNTVYITREPTLDSLNERNVEAPDGSKTMPISDIIKNDFDLYNFTGAHVMYWKRWIWIAVPAEGLVLAYDMSRNIWMPPFTIPVSRLGVLADQLIGHSATTNETYTLWTGTNDNGAPIAQIARFAYNNGGRRDRLKNMATYWSDGYITSNGVLNLSAFFEYQGTAGIRTFQLLGTNSNLVKKRTAFPVGNRPLGNVPLGGANPASPGGIEENSNLLRFQWAQTLKQTDYFEHFVQYSMETLDGQFAIVAHGSDQWDGGTSPVTHNT